MSRSQKKPWFSKIAQINWGMILLIVIVSCAGFAMMYSAANGDFFQWAFPQIKRFILLMIGMIILACIDIQLILRFAYVPYVVTLVLLVLVELIGATIMGAQRWLVVGGFSLQPSELMKLSLVLALARYFHFQHIKDIASPFSLIIPLLMVLVPFGLILHQPDLGTAMILLMVGGAVFFAAGIRLWKFAVVIAAGLAVIPFAWFELLHDYQKQRVLTFLDPQQDPLGAGYNILQSQIAIGSGGFSGKGFMSGTQNQLSFLPEKHTDFIFTMYSEELGFIGSTLLIICYGFLLLYGIVISLNSQNHFGRLIAIGAISLFFFHVFINIAMVMGLIPVVGVPLPLLSYGGTIMMTMLTAFGLIQNVHLNRDKQLNRNLE